MHIQDMGGPCVIRPVPQREAMCCGYRGQPFLVLCRCLQFGGRVLSCHGPEPRPKGEFLHRPHRNDECNASCSCFCCRSVARMQPTPHPRGEHDGNEADPGSGWTKHPGYTLQGRLLPGAQRLSSLIDRPRDPARSRAGHRTRNGGLGNKRGSLLIPPLRRQPPLRAMRG